MGKAYIISAILLVCAGVLFLLQRKRRSEALVMLAGVCAGAAFALLLITLCVNTIFIRPFYD